MTDVSVWPIEDRDEDDDVDADRAFATSPGSVRYVSPDQVESWGLFRWRTA